MSCIPLSFQLKKQKILNALAKPVAEYTDQSPKGSIDEGIQHLIEQINKLDGFVTTSSCAGRISVYLEGKKESIKQKDDDYDGNQGAGFEEQMPAQTAVPGGKGAGGRWLYVSHDPVRLPSGSSPGEMHLMKLFGFSSDLDEGIMVNSATRYVRLAFEPMVRHHPRIFCPHGILSSARYFM